MTISQLLKQRVGDQCQGKWSSNWFPARKFCIILPNCILVLRRKSRPSSSFSDSLGVLYLPSETQKPSFFALLPLLLQLSFPFPPIFSLIRRGVSLPSLSLRWRIESAEEGGRGPRPVSGAVACSELALKGEEGGDPKGMGFGS